MALREEPSGTPEGDSSTGSTSGEVVQNYSGTGVTAVLVVAFVALILAVVFLAQNTDTVPVEFLGFDGEAPLFVVVLTTLVASALGTLALAEIWRRRRRRRRSEHDELVRLRNDRAV